MNIVFRDPPRGQIQQLIDRLKETSVYQALDRAEVSLCRVDGETTVLLEPKGAADLWDLVQSTSALAEAAQSILETGTLTIYWKRVCVHDHNFSVLQYPHISMSTSHETQGGFMFRRLMQHVGRLYAAKQRWEMDLLWEEIERLEGVCIQRDREVECLKMENAWLAQRLELTTAALQEVSVRGQEVPSSRQNP